MKKRIVVILIFVVVLLISSIKIYEYNQIKNTSIFPEEFNSKTSYFVNNVQDDSNIKKEDDPDKIQPIINFFNTLKLNEVVYTMPSDIYYEIILISVDAEIIRITIQEENRIIITYDLMKKTDVSNKKSYSRYFKFIDGEINTYELDKLFQNFDDYN
ncbi:MAG TPA: hypothetical protein DDX29_11820 [Clostridiales bacterium]|nr:hypothetical protein [Clostridiales bacterium]